MPPNLLDRRLNLGFFFFRKMRTKKLGFILAVIIVGAAAASAGEGSEAYVTLLYGDEFLLGVRVLGKSIRDTGSDKDMVVLASDGVSDFAKRLLQADGWIVEIISLLANPNQVRPKRLWGVYTKLKIFNMIKYKKVIYLDADTIVVKNVDDLFKCGKFCATLKHSERLNSGVMVVEPSETVFKDMMSKVYSLPSYTGGDQGFLNSYYADFANAHLFEPNMPPELVKSRPVPEMERLSTIYNADVGLYMLANKWMVDEKELRIIHYTLGPLKPWDWWTSFVVKPVYLWQNIRDQLVESLPGTGGGTNPKEQLMIKILLTLPLCVLLFFYYKYNLQISKAFLSTFGRCSLCFYAKRAYYRLKSGGGFHAYSGISVATSPTVNSCQQFPNGMHSKIPPSLGAMSVVFCFMAAILSFALAFILVPNQVKPWMGLLLIYEWTFTTFFILFGSYLHAIHQWGNSSNHKGAATAFEDESVKGHQCSTSSCDIVTWFYWMGMAFLAILIPSLPSLLGITALFARLGLMVAGTLVLASFMTCASEYLAIRAFVRGFEMV